MPRDLIAELRERKQLGALMADGPLFKGDFSPLSQEAIENAEARLGFPLPTTVRRIYREVANGGFGPGYGLLGLNGGMQNEDRQDAITLYKSYCESDPEDEHWNWPPTLLPLGHLGCAMYLCADCSCDAAPIIWFEPNPHELGQPWDDSFFCFASSLDEWLLAWLDGRDLFNELISSDESPENRKWNRGKRG